VKQNAEWVRKRTEAKIINLCGQRFGRLTAVSLLPRQEGQKRKWRGLCSCGGTADIVGHQLRKGHTQSCGCIKREETIARNTKHGLCRVYPREYGAWKDMRARCRNPNNTDWKDYGGRGITICAEWEDFAKFFADMGPKPSRSHSLDRREVNGNYEPANCRWADAEMQASNQRRVHLLTINGQSKTVAAWARYFGIDRTKAEYRLKMGMKPEVAFKDDIDLRAEPPPTS